MKIITTAVLLVITLFAIPVFSYFFDIAPGPAEWKALNILVLMMAVVIACAGPAVIVISVSGLKEVLFCLFT